jgi:hypothetical protein
MAEKRKIKGLDVLADMQAGMSGSELMEKYRLSTQGLEFILRQLSDAANANPGQFYGRSEVEEETEDTSGIRMLARTDMMCPLRVYDEKNPDIQGTVRDITSKGLGIRGFDVRVGQICALVICADEFFQIDRFGFRAVCRWIKTDPLDGERVAGFEISKIPTSCEKQLQNLMELVDYMY